MATVVVLGAAGTGEFAFRGHCCAGRAQKRAGCAPTTARCRRMTSHRPRAATAGHNCPILAYVPALTAGKSSLVASLCGSAVPRAYSRENCAALHAGCKCSAVPTSPGVVRLPCSERRGSLLIWLVVPQPPVSRWKPRLCSWTRPTRRCRWMPWSSTGQAQLRTRRCLGPAPRRPSSLSCCGGLRQSSSRTMSPGGPPLKLQSLT